MSTVIDFPLESAKLKSARREFRLTLTQAVCALQDVLDIDLAPNTLENWENGRPPSIDIPDPRTVYSRFVERCDNVQKTGKNLIFGSVPVSAARDILDLTHEEIASLFGYKKSFWLKIEANSRFLPNDKLVELEGMLATKFTELCSPRE